ncbi:hypothetical protein Bca101_018647 [Brassica carinata]
MFGLNRVEEGFKTEEEEEKIVIWQQFSWDFPSVSKMASLKQVEEVVSLLVFENLSTCPVKDFLGESQWLKTATEVNAAILSSFGKGPKLQRLLKKLTLNQKKLDERACEYPRMSDMSTEKGRLKNVTNIDGIFKIVFESNDVPEIDAFRMR